MLESSSEVRNLVLGDVKGFDFFPEIRLNKCGSLIFDGVHKVDVSALSSESYTCIAIEVKLGLDRLSKNEFNKRFISNCGTSHLETRVKGSMISILEGRLPEQCTGNLSVTYSFKAYELRESWVLICREKVIKNWDERGYPNLSKNCKIVCFESLVELYGGKERFNLLVSDLLDHDYYNEWMGIHD
jgi:hypothetical protein